MVADSNRLELRLEANPEAARIVRARVEDIADQLEPDVRDDLLLLVTELVTNSIRHGSPGPGGVGIAIALDADCVRLEVTDAGPGFSPGTEEEMADPASGWGLYLVDRLAADWGTESSKDGTRVWLELPRR